MIPISTDAAVQTSFFLCSSRAITKVSYASKRKECYYQIQSTARMTRVLMSASGIMFVLQCNVGDTCEGHVGHQRYAMKCYNVHA